MMQLRSLGVVLCALVLVACTRSASPLPAVPEATATPAAPVTFPRDASPHSTLTEWWYYTGHLQSPTDGRHYGFEFTVFQAERQDAPVGYLAHFAISDVDGKRFSHAAHFTQRQAVSGFPIDVDGWTLASDDSISASMNDFSLQLQLSDEKPPALHHGGYFEYGAVGGSYYYSRTRLAATGQLNGQTVSGIAWMDHQWGNFVVSSGLVWDWYSLQLDDRTEYMLYVLRGSVDDSPAVFGTFVDANGSVRDLDAGSVHADPVGTWTSPHSSGVYPSGWALTLPDGARVTATPELEDQELYFPDARGAAVSPMTYWEGAVRVTGDRSGVGYVELTGYAGR